PVDPPPELDPVDDIAPLVRPAELCAAADPPRQLEKVKCLEDHVVELEERQRLLAVEPQLHTLECQHSVDREMLADLAQELNIFEPVEPVGVVDHDRVAWTLAERQEMLEHAADAGNIRVDLLVGEELSALVLASGVSNFRRSAAHH